MAYGTTYDPENSTGRLLALKKKFHRKPSDVLSMDVPEEVGNVGANIPGRLAWQYHFEKLQNIRESRAIPNTDRFLGRDQSVVAAEIQRRREALMPRLAQLGYSTNLSTIDQIEQAEKNVRRVNVMKNLEASKASRKASKFVAPESIINAKEAKKYTEKKTSSAENRVEQINIRKGVESAITGTKANKAFRQLFGFGIGLGLVRSAARYVIGSSLQSSMMAQRTSLSSIMTGASFKDLYGAGGIAKLFGGSETDAASMYASINAFRSGALMGRGMGQLGKLLDYRTVITPFMSEKEILDSIARRYHEIGVEQGAGIQALYASETGLSAPIIKAMSEHWENFSEWMETEMPKISDAQQEMLEDQARAARELGVAFDNLKDELAIKLIPILDYWTDVFNEWTGESRYKRAIEKIDKEHPEWTLRQRSEYLDKQGLGRFIPKTITEREGLPWVMGGAIVPSRTVEKHNPLYEDYWNYKKLQEFPLPTFSTPVPSIDNKTSSVFQIDINSTQDMYGLAVALGNTTRSYLGEEGIGINIRSVA